jgi:hypothetical protein
MRIKTPPPERISFPTGTASGIAHALDSPYDAYLKKELNYTPKQLSSFYSGYTAEFNRKKAGKGSAHGDRE